MDSCVTSVISCIWHIQLFSVRFEALPVQLEFRRRRSMTPDSESSDALTVSDRRLALGGLDQQSTAALALAA